MNRVRQTVAHREVIWEFVRAVSGLEFDLSAIRSDRGLQRALSELGQTKSDLVQIGRRLQSLPELEASRASDLFSGNATHIAREHVEIESEPQQLDQAGLIPRYMKMFRNIQATILEVARELPFEIAGIPEVPLTSLDSPTDATDERRSGSEEEVRIRERPESISNNLPIAALALAGDTLFDQPRVSVGEHPTRCPVGCGVSPKGHREPRILE